MAITVEELFGRGKGDKSHARSYVVKGTTDPDAAETAALAEAPVTASGFGVRSARARELPARDSVGGAFEVSVLWSSGSGSPSSEADGSVEYSFRIQPASAMVKQSRSTQGYYPAAASTPQFGGAINVDTDLKVQGVQWPPPASQVLGFDGTYDAARVTQSYFRQLCLLAGRVNDATYTGFPSGELLFLGATGRRRGLGPWQIHFDLGFLPNETSITLGGITVATKLGWDYLWPFYKIQPHNDGSDDVAMVVKPRSIYVERIAQLGSFGGLEPDAI